MIDDDVPAFDVEEPVSEEEVRVRALKVFEATKRVVAAAEDLVLARSLDRPTKGRFERLQAALDELHVARA